jgi:uncharacterized membrane protein YdbT with pleckstrin-like domain
MAESERFVLDVRRHPALLLRSFCEAILVVFAAVFLGTWVSPGAGTDIFDTVGGLVATIFVLRFAWRVWLWSADRVIVTDRRIFEVSGVLARRVASTPLSKVTDMTYRRSIAGRLLGYGDLILESPGQKQALEAIGYLPRPDDFYRTITALVMTSSPPASVPTFDLWDDGDQANTGPLPRVTI